MNKTTGEQEEIIVREPQTNRLYGVKVFSREVQQVNPDHPCAYGNGGCEKFCFAVPNNETGI